MSHLSAISLVVILLAIGAESLPANATNVKPTDEKTNGKENEHTIEKRAIRCSNSGNVRGTLDFTGADSKPGPCEVDITEIRVKWGSVIDGIQVVYKSLDGEVIEGPRHGGTGGHLKVISLEEGERITGVAGMICDFAPVKFVHRLAFFSTKADGQKMVYGPYGIAPGNNCNLFAVNAKINSIYGVTTTRRNFVALGDIGFFFEESSPAPQSME